MAVRLIAFDVVVSAICFLFVATPFAATSEYAGPLVFVAVGGSAINVYDANSYLLINQFQTTETTVGTDMASDTDLRVVFALQTVSPSVSVQKYNVSGAVGSASAGFTVNGDFMCYSQPDQRLYATSIGITNAIGTLPSNSTNGAWSSIQSLAVVNAGLACDGAGRRIFYGSLTTTSLVVLNMDNPSFNPRTISMPNQISPAGADFAYSSRTSRLYYLALGGIAYTFNSTAFATLYSGGIPGLSGSSRCAIIQADKSTHLDEYLWITAGNSLLLILASTTNFTVIKNISLSDAASGVAYLPALPPLEPPSNSQGTSADLSSLDATFGIVANATDQNEETTYTSYRDFTLSSGETISFPSGWLKTQDLSGNSYIVQYQAPLSSTTTISLSALFNPTDNVTVDLSDNESYSLQNGALKYTLMITGEPGTDIFSNIESRSISWTACFTNSQTQSPYSTDYDSIIAGSVTAYIFYREDTNSNSILRINIPNVASIDGVTTIIAHTVAAKQLNTGNLEICVSWKFPYFAHNLTYDPDMSVLPGGPRPGANGKSGGDGDVPIEIIVPVIVGAAFVLVCLCIITIIVVTAILTYQRKRSRRKTITSQMLDI